MKTFFWKKLGKVFSANNEHEWMNTHSAPLAAIILNDIIRVYFCTRTKSDSNGNFISNASFIDLDINDPTQIRYIHDKPLFKPGKYGIFDEFGIMVTEAIRVDNKIYLYYLGWQRLGGGTAAYQVMLGLGISEDGGYTFTKYSDGPILSIDTYDPVSIGNVAVIKEKDIWRMYYTSFTEWILTGSKPSYEYVIKYAESRNGIQWSKTGRTVIDIENGFAVATPTVMKDDNVYHMWFGYRKCYDEKSNVGGYSLGYSYSFDGIDWQRNDRNSNLMISDTGWDSEMICYPTILKTHAKTFLFYCGNGFGRDGFGVAELIDN